MVCCTNAKAANTPCVVLLVCLPINKLLVSYTPAVFGSSRTLHSSVFLLLTESSVGIQRRIDSLQFKLEPSE